MERIDGVLGNINEDDMLRKRISEHESEGTLERVRINADERKRSRLRVETEYGTDLGLLPDKALQSGDVLALDNERAIIVEFEQREAAVIELPEPTAESVTQVLKLGHRIGNQHWDLAVHEGTLYISASADREIIDDVLGPYLPAGSEIRFEIVDAGLWINRADTDSVDGGHQHGTDHNYGHEHGYGQDHSHSHHDGPNTNHDKDGKHDE